MRYPSKRISARPNHLLFRHERFATDIFPIIVKSFWSVLAAEGGGGVAGDLLKNTAEVGAMRETDGFGNVVDRGCVLEKEAGGLAHADLGDMAGG